MEINPEDAEELGIDEAEMVIIESPRGQAKMRAHITSDILQKVIHMPHGWSGEANVNLLTNDSDLDPIDGYPAFRVCLCRVRKIKEC